MGSSGSGGMFIDTRSYPPAAGGAGGIFKGTTPVYLCTFSETDKFYLKMLDILVQQNLKQGAHFSRRLGAVAYLIMLSSER